MSCIVCEKAVIRVSTAIPVCRWSAACAPGACRYFYFTEKSYIYHIDFKKIFYDRKNLLPGGKTLIEVKNLVKRYGRHLAVDGLSFQVEEGQIYGFLGPNGAGKSTTMNIMTGYIGATEGEVLINGHDILKEPEEAKKHIGYLPEQPPLYMEMTVREYLCFAGELKKIPKDKLEEQIAEAMELTKLKESENRLIHNLSKGYRQRVGLAQAILGFPEIIILDEPTVGLDPKQIIEIRQLIRSLAKRHTVILSSHILAEIREVCDYIMIISRGRLVASDTPDNLENLMNKTAYTQIQAREPEDRIRNILGSLECIEAAEYSAEDEGVTTVRIQGRDKEDIREKLFLAFAEQKVPLQELRLVKSTLEEVFLELTQEGKEAETDESNI